MADQLTPYLQETILLDFHTPTISQLIEQRGWQALTAYEKIAQTYAFVRDEIAFGYNVDDARKASEVLKEGIGQCNTKSTLLMALLRAVGIPCRLHGFTIDKALQKGAQAGLVYRLAPQEIVHSWTEVYYEGHWLTLEGVILDKTYLQAVQKNFAEHKGAFYGYGLAVADLEHINVDWQGEDTYIQSLGIVQDFGLYASPDAFFVEHSQSLPFCKRWLYQHIGRKLMNNRVDRMRCQNTNHFTSS